MRWGFRKQENGTVKPSGKKAAAPKSEDAAKADELRKKPVSSMSNAELETLTRRLQLEQSYSSLAFKQDTKEIRRGQEIVKTILDAGKMTKDVANLADTALNSPSVGIIRDIMRR